MSRRREAADLARALELSTQQARVFANTSPHFLSSSDHATQDSREMELRPVEPAAVQSSTGLAGMEAQTIETAEQDMRPPTVVANIGEASFENISSFSAKPTAVSDIQSFSPTVNPNTFILVPESVSNNTSGTDSSSHKSYPPSSFPAHLLNPSPNPLNSSPIQPSAVVRDSLGSSSNATSHTSSKTGVESSSNNPNGVSPTLLSTAAAGSSLPPPAKKFKQYGKAAKVTPSPLKKSAHPTAIGSSSPSLPVRTEKRRVMLSSDNEEDGPVQTVGESTPAVAARPSSPSSKSPQKNDAPISPDPLDSINKGRKKVASPTRSAVVVEIPLSSRRMSAKMGEDNEKEDKARLEKDVDTLMNVESSTSTSSFPSSLSTSLQSHTSSEPQPKPKPKKRKFDPLEIPDVDESEDEDFQPGKKKAKPKAKPKPKAKAAPKEKKDKKPAAGKKGKPALSAEVIVDDEVDVPVAAASPPLAEPATTVVASATSATEAIAAPNEPPNPVEAPAAAPSPPIESAADLGDGPVSIPTPAPSSASAKKLSPAKQSKTAKQPSTTKASNKKKGKAPAPPPSPPLEVQMNKENTPSPVKSQSGAKSKSPTPPTPAKPPPSRVLQKTPSNTNMGVSTPASGASRSSSVAQEGTPGPGGMKWKTSRNDLSSVLAKFGGHKRTGMSKKLNIVPLHAKIGTPAKALPPVPKKPQKKVESEDDDDDDDGEKKVKPGSKEWLMMED
ncbi:hypothetical protein IAR50_000094 [Cryptococcus sp. DSM 104548]